MGLRNVSSRWSPNQPRVCLLIPKGLPCEAWQPLVSYVCRYPVNLEAWLRARALSQLRPRDIHVRSTGVVSSIFILILIVHTFALCPSGRRHSGQAQHCIGNHFGASRRALSSCTPAQARTPTRHTVWDSSSRLSQSSQMRQTRYAQTSTSCARSALRSTLSTRHSRVGCT